MKRPPKSRATTHRADDSVSESAPALLSGQRFLPTREVMRLLGYSNRASFWQTVRQNGPAFIRVNSRRALFAEADVQAWLKSRKIGDVPVTE